MSDKAGAKKAMSEANVEFKAGKYDAALEKYNEAVKLDPDEVQYVANRANVYLKLKKWKEAEDDCTAAIKINDKYAKVCMLCWNLKAKVYFALSIVNLYPSL